MLEKGNKGPKEEQGEVNIAEVYGRRSPPEHLRFFNIAPCFINQLETHLILSKKVGLWDKKDTELIIS
ncbi:MAG: four helix bundle protein [Xenococcaceae cyanobacterium]